MISTRVRSRLGVTAACVGFLTSIAACNDSTGPSKLAPSDALQSLALGMGSLLVVPSAIPPGMDESLDELASVLDQVDVTIDGKTQTMFALGMRETFPAGTCLESVFVFPSIPPEPGVCTPPLQGLGVIMWQSHSAFAPPDRMIFLVTDVGAVDFDVNSFIEYDFAPEALPLSGVAMYAEGEDDFWMSVSGSVTSQVAATSQSCGLPLPPYAKSGSCSVATFDEQGTIIFEPFTEDGPSTRRLNVNIPRQTIHGLWLNITETQPYTFPDYQRLTRMLRIRN